MADRHTPEQRRYNMSCVKGQNTKPEKLVRSILHRNGYRFRLQVKELPGKPDIVLPKHKKVIFVHGCFWHSHKDCLKSSRPSTNMEFWDKKLDANVQRDSSNHRQLKNLGWKILVVWECQTKNALLLKKILLKFMTNQ